MARTQRQLGIRVNPTMDIALTRMARKLNVSKNELIRTILEKGLKELEEKEEVTADAKAG